MTIFYLILCLHLLWILVVRASGGPAPWSVSSQRVPQRLPQSDDFGRWSDYSEPPARGGLTWDACAPRERAAPCPSTSFGLGLCQAERSSSGLRSSPSSLRRRGGRLRRAMDSVDANRRPGAPARRGVPAKIFRSRPRPTHRRRLEWDCRGDSADLGFGRPREDGRRVSPLGSSLAKRRTRPRGDRAEDLAATSSEHS